MKYVLEYAHQPTTRAVQRQAPRRGWKLVWRMILDLGDAKSDVPLRWYVADRSAINRRRARIRARRVSR